MISGALYGKYLPFEVAKGIKAFKEQYKSENGENFKGDVITKVTFGVIDDKNIPDADDVVRLIKWLGVGCTDEEAWSKLGVLLDLEDYKDRGLLGLFCDLSIKLVTDIPVCDEYKKAMEGLEAAAINKFKLMSELRNIGDKLGELVSGLQSDVNKISEDTAENKEDTVEDTVEA